MLIVQVDSTYHECNYEPELGTKIPIYISKNSCKKNYIILIMVFVTGQLNSSYWRKDFSFQRRKDEEREKRNLQSRLFLIRQSGFIHSYVASKEDPGQEKNASRSCRFSFCFSHVSVLLQWLQVQKWFQLIFNTTLQAEKNSVLQTLKHIYLEIIDINKN